MTIIQNAVIMRYLGKVPAYPVQNVSHDTGSLKTDL